MQNKAVPLGEDLMLVPVSEEEWKPFYEAHVTQVFEQTVLFDFLSLRSPEENARLKELGRPFEQVWRKCYFFQRGEEILGWGTLRQTAYDTVYMENTGILKPYQGQGIYTKYLPVVLKIMRDAGFQVVYSRHAASNNAVLIPKLRAGFQITHLEVADRFGVLIHLTYHFSEDRRRMIDFRAGQRKMPRHLEGNIDLFSENE